MNDAAPVLRCDEFLNGRLRLWQPARGYRAGADAVMLAAAVSAQPGQSVLELGCGAGVALICLGTRVGGLVLSGLERVALYAGLARRNAAEAGLPARILTGDLAAPPPELRGESFDHVLANPPFFGPGPRSPDALRAAARHEETPLELWIDAGLRRLRPDGRLTMIHQADRLDAILSALAGRAGAVSILPIAARAGRDAGRVIVTARKGARSPLRLRAPFIMHQGAAHAGDGDDLTPAAQAVLRHGHGLLTDH